MLSTAVTDYRHASSCRNHRGSAAPTRRQVQVFGRHIIHRQAPLGPLSDKTTLVSGVCGKDRDGGLWPIGLATAAARHGRLLGVNLPAATPSSIPIRRTTGRGAS